MQVQYTLETELVSHPQVTANEFINSFQALGPISIALHHNNNDHSGMSNGLNNLSWGSAEITLHLTHTIKEAFADVLKLAYGLVKVDPLLNILIQLRCHGLQPWNIKGRFCWLMNFDWHLRKLGSQFWYFSLHNPSSWDKLHDK